MFVFASNSGHFRINDTLLFLAPLLLLNYFCFIFFFAKKWGWGSLSHPSPSLCAVPVYRVMKIAVFFHTSSESIVHLFWSCRQTSHFWNKLTEWLKHLNLLSRDFVLTNITALGLKPDISQFPLLINYCFLLARYHIWLAQRNGNLLQDI